MRHNISWWQSRTRFNMIDVLSSDMDKEARFSARISIDYIETNIDNFKAWLLSVAESIPESSIKGQPASFGLTSLQEISTAHSSINWLDPYHYLLYQDLTLTPDDTNLQVYSEQAIRYEIKQVTYDRVLIEASCWASEVKEVRLAFERTIDKIYKTWFEGKIRPNLVRPDATWVTFSESPQDANSLFGPVIHYKGNIQQVKHALDAFTQTMEWPSIAPECIVYGPPEIAGHNQIPPGTSNVVFRFSDEVTIDGFYFRAIEYPLNKVTLTVMPNWLEKNGKIRWLDETGWERRNSIWGSLKEYLNNQNAVIHDETKTMPVQQQEQIIIGTAAPTVEQQSEASSIQIDTMISDVKSFVIEYNRFIRGLRDKCKAAGDLDSAFWLNTQWVIHDLPVDKSAPGLKIVLTDEGHLVLNCHAERFVEEFKQFWQECQKRWIKLVEHNKVLIESFPTESQPRLKQDFEKPQGSITETTSKLRNEPKVIKRWGCPISGKLDTFDRWLDAACMEMWRNTSPVAPGYKRDSNDIDWVGFCFLDDSETPLASISATAYSNLKIEIEQYEVDTDIYRELSVRLSNFLCDWVYENYQVKPEEKSIKPRSLHDYSSERETLEQLPETSISLALKQPTKIEGVTDSAKNKLSTTEKYRLEICRQAIAAKRQGMDFLTFCEDKGYTRETLRRWIRELKAKEIKDLDWKD